MAGPLALVLAHQGGWDEILMVAVPLLVVGVVLAVANRRAKEQLLRHEHGPAEPSADDDS